MLAELVVESDDCVGESPRWQAAGGWLWWVDNERATVHRYHASSGASETFDVAENVTSLAITSGETLLATCAGGVRSLGRDGLDALLVPMSAGDPRCSFNDSGCDARGRLWVGTGSEAVGGEGCLWLVDPETRTARLARDGLSLPNGIGFSPDSTTMYLVDSVERVVYRADYDLGDGAIGQLETLCAFDDAEGLPDGLAVDHHGGVWVALWGGGCVRRYDPFGDLDAEVQLPVQLVAGCAFGGVELTDLYVTTAWYELSAAERARQPLAGSLFRIRTPTRGTPIEPVSAAQWGVATDPSKRD